MTSVNAFAKHFFLRTRTHTHTHAHAHTRTHLLSKFKVHVLFAPI